MENHKKVLILDRSAFQPLATSVEKKWLLEGQLREFCVLAGIDELHFTRSAAQKGEATYTKQPTFWDVTASDVESVFVSSQADTGFALGSSQYSVSLSGSLTSDALVVQDSFQVCVVNDLALQKPETAPLVRSSGYWRSMSTADQSALIWAAHCAGQGNDVAILANENSLRQQAKLELVKVYGSLSILAAMVFHHIISYQKGTALYRRWGLHDPRWIIGDMSFGEILGLEEDRFVSQKSFWIDRRRLRNNILCGCGPTS